VLEQFDVTREQIVAVLEFVAQSEINEVNEGLRQADAGEFVPQEEVDAFFTRIKA